MLMSAGLVATLVNRSVLIQRVPTPASAKTATHLGETSLDAEVGC